MDIERRIPEHAHSELLRGKDLYAREQKALMPVLGVEVPVKPLPRYITPEVQQNLLGMGFALRYIPRIDPDNNLLFCRRVDEALGQLQKSYPKWKPFELLSASEQADHRVSRNLERGFWELASLAQISHPFLQERWIAVETIAKPPRDVKYQTTPFAETLGFAKDRRNVSWNNIYAAIEREKQRALQELGLSGRNVDIRLLNALEWNLLGNREGWGKTNSYEWTDTFKINMNRMIIGSSDIGGAAGFFWDHPDYSGMGVGFRSAIILRA